MKEKIIYVLNEFSVVQLQEWQADLTELKRSEVLTKMTDQGHKNLIPMLEDMALLASELTPL